jgi:transcriptional regulator with XRE-family HTH domain
MAKRVQLYKFYKFGKGDKDPVIDKIHTMLDTEGVDYTQAAERSGVSRSTIVEWIEGETRQPKYCTIAAVAAGLGYEQTFVKKRVA